MSQYDDVDPRDQEYGEGSPARRGPRPRESRGTTVLVLGILGLVLCVICAIIAWVMGAGDLKAMRNGTMDRRQESETRIGMVLGVVSVVLHGIGILIGILAFAGVIALGGPFFEEVRREMDQQRARRHHAEADAQLATLTQAIDSYRKAHDKLPVTLQDLTRTTDLSPQPVLHSLPRDPWNHPYRYEVQGTTRYRLFSTGADGQPDTEDDIAYEGTAPPEPALPTERR